VTPAGRIELGAVGLPPSDDRFLGGYRELLPADGIVLPVLEQQDGAAFTRDPGRDERQSTMTLCVASKSAPMTNGRLAKRESNSCSS
jgi:hypothetical protein